MTLQSNEFTGHLENRLPTISVALSLTSFVFVILTGQVGLYFWKTPIHGRDSLWIKGIVVFIWLMQALEVALGCHMTVLAHGNDSILAKEVVSESLWETAIYLGTSATTECLVHAFLISRIYLLGTNTHHLRISIMLFGILILEGSFGFISVLSLIISSSTGSRVSMAFWSVPVWLGLAILADILIAGSMCYILKRGSPFVSMRLNLLVKRLTRFCIQTGLITSVITVITVAIWAVAQFDIGHFCMSMPTGGVYALCMMANLIARESYFCHIQIDEDGECFGMATRSIVFATPESFKKDENI